MNKQHIGIDLGSRWIKIARIGKGPESFFIEDTTYFEAVGHMNEKKYYKAVRYYLEEYAKEHQIKKMNIRISIPPNIEDGTSLTMLKLPTADDFVIKKAVKFEIVQQEVLSNLGDEHILWEKIDEDIEQDDEYGELKQSHVLVATIRKNIIYELAQMRKLTWKIDRIDLQQDTVGRFIKGDATVIDFGHKNTRIYFFKEGKLKSFETLEIGGRYLTESIQIALGSQSLEMVEDIKHKTTVNFESLNQNLMSESLRVASETVTEVVKNLADEIKRSIRSFELGNVIMRQNIYYTGGGAALNNLIPFLMDELDEEIKPLYQSMTDEGVGNELTNSGEADVVEDDNDDEFSDFLLSDEFSDFLKTDNEEDNGSNEENMEFFEESEGPDVDTVENSEEETIELRSNIYSGTRFFENIIPEESEYYDLAILTTFSKEEVEVSGLDFSKFLKFKFDLNSLLIALVVMTITLFFGVKTVHEQYDNNINHLNSAVSEQSTKITNIQSESRQLTQKKSNYEQLINLVDDLKGQNKWYSSILYTVPEETPSGIAVQHIRIQGDVVVLEGYATDYSNVGFFAMELEEYGEVKIAEISDLENSNIIITDILDTDQLSENDAVSKIFKIEVRQSPDNSHDEFNDNGKGDMHFEDEYGKKENIENDPALNSEWHEEDPLVHEEEFR